MSAVEREGSETWSALLDRLHEAASAGSVGEEAALLGAARAFPFEAVAGFSDKALQRFEVMLYRRHPFAGLRAHERERLRGFLETLAVASLEGDKAAAAMSAYVASLRGLLATCEDGALMCSPAAKAAISAEYPAALQLAVLGLKLGTMTPPVLDLGCGGGALVSHLRSWEGSDAVAGAGIEAYGVDRFVEARAPYLRRGDWLETPLGEARWGLIISHMGYSNHFWHHHLRSGGEAELYARRYRAILEALKVGGVFAYAPGLPFMERLLPRDRYRVIQRPLEPSLLAALPAAVSKKIRSGFYSARVVRRG